MPTDESSREAVLARLKPHLPTLDQCFRAAWARWTEWLKVLEGSPADVTTRSRASVLYDFIAAEAIRAFLKVDGVRVKKERGFLVLRFQDRIALRFKKFRSKTLGVSVNKTGQTELFHSQMLEFAPGSVKPMTHVIAGYLLDGLQVDFARLAITCTYESRPMWAPIEILPASAGTVTALPGTTAPAPRPVVRSTRKQRRADEAGPS